MPDRLSAQNLSANNPPKISRSVTGQSQTSPLSQRLSIGPRSSSLTNSPNNSINANLSGTSRLQRGSSLKYELNEEPAEGVEDPLDVVHRIIRAVPRPGNSKVPGDGIADIPERPKELASNIDFGGLSLEEFAGVSQAEEESDRGSANATITTTSSALPVKDCKYS